MPFAGCALELFIARKILDQKTRPLFSAKEFSFKQHSYAEICFVIDKFINQGALSVYCNTTPEDLTYDYDETEKTGLEGVKWSVVKRVERDQEELKWACFDFDMEDEVKLRGIIDIGLSEFMNDKAYGESGHLTGMLIDISLSELTYEQQKDIVLKSIAPNNTNEATIDVSYYSHPKVDIVRTLLALEKERILQVKEFTYEHRKNPNLDGLDDDNNNVKSFDDKDEVFAKIRLIKKPQDVLAIKIVGMPELKIANRQAIQEKSIQQKPELQYLIRKAGMDYFVADKLLRFDNTDAIYFKIFDVLFEKRDTNGFCSYETLNQELERGGEEHIEDRAKMVERISNGSKNLFRYSNLSKKARDGKEIIQTKRGKGLILYNPPIK